MNSEEREAIEAVLKHYISAIWNHDTDMMTQVFHPCAVLSSHFEGEFSIVPAVEAIVGYMNEVPPIQETSPDFSGEIVSVDQVGTAASAIVREYNLEGMNFTTYFHLHKVDSEWRITSKSTFGDVI